MLRMNDGPLGHLPHLGAEYRGIVQNYLLARDVHSPTSPGPKRTRSMDTTQAKGAANPS